MLALRLAQQQLHHGGLGLVAVRRILHLLRAHVLLARTLPQLLQPQTFELCSERTW